MVHMTVIKSVDRRVSYFPTAARTEEGIPKRHKLRLLQELLARRRIGFNIVQSSSVMFSNRLRPKRLLFEMPRSSIKWLGKSRYPPFRSS